VVAPPSPHSSGDRASASGAEGRRFESYWGHFLGLSAGIGRLVEFEELKEFNVIHAGEAEPSPIGWLPKSLNTEGLDIAAEALESLLSVDRDLVRQDLEDAETFLAQFGDRLPARISEELRATRERLSL
jgi:hypothetical protein